MVAPRQFVLGSLLSASESTTLVASRDAEKPSRISMHASLAVTLQGLARARNDIQGYIDFIE